MDGRVFCDYVRFYGRNVEHGKSRGQMTDDGKFRRQIADEDGRSKTRGRRSDGRRWKTRRTVIIDRREKARQV